VSIANCDYCFQRSQNYYCRRQTVVDVPTTAFGSVPIIGVLCVYILFLKEEQSRSQDIRALLGDRQQAEALLTLFLSLLDQKSQLSIQ